MDFLSIYWCGCMVMCGILITDKYSKSFEGILWKVIVILMSWLGVGIILGGVNNDLEEIKKLLIKKGLI